jgi:hypothetical protein
LLRYERRIEEGSGRFLKKRRKNFFSSGPVALKQARSSLKEFFATFCSQKRAFPIKQAPA